MAATSEDEKTTAPLNCILLIQFSEPCIHFFNTILCRGDADGIVRPPGPKSGWVDRAPERGERFSRPVDAAKTLSLGPAERGRGLRRL